MEAKFTVGDIVYVMGKILTVEEQENDVRYSVATSIAKYFCTEVNDSIRRSADSQGMLDKTFEEGREAYYDALSKIAVMNIDQLHECYGNNYNALEDLFTIGEYSYSEIVDMYITWWNTKYTKVNDIVELEQNNETITCVVMKTRLYSINDDGTTEYEDVDPETIDPTALPNIAYVLFDPLNQLIYTEVGSDNFTNTNKTFDISTYIDKIAEDFSNVDGMELGMYTPDDDEVISEDDPDYEDDEYEEDDIDEVPEPGDED